MRQFLRTAGTVAIALSAVLALAACGEEDGQALPGAPVTQPPATSAPSTAPSAPAEGDSALAQVNACDLLSDAQAAEIVDGVQRRDAPLGPGISSRCGWSHSDNPDVHPEDAMAFSISIWPAETVDQVPVRGDAKVTDGKVGDREAKQVAENEGIPGGCRLAFAAGSGRVDINAESEDTELSCSAVNEISTIIEPKLPKP